MPGFRATRLAEVTFSGDFARISGNVPAYYRKGVAVNQREFGRRLRAARGYGHAETGEEITQEEFAEAVGYGRNKVRDWETGEGPLKPGVRSGLVSEVTKMTGLTPEFFDVDFDELEQAMEHLPTLRVDWSPEGEMVAGLHPEDE